jgi:aminoglycoside phosphotransferase (APT) family kinase protein
VAWVAELSDPLRTLDAPRRFIHHDLWPEHLVVDPATGQLVGILDWTDTLLGDAAGDFVTLAAFGGWGFLEQVLENYPHEVDEGFRQRLRFMAQFLSVMWLGEAQRLGRDIERHIAWVRNAFAAEL